MKQNESIFKIDTTHLFSFDQNRSLLVKDDTTTMTTTTLTGTTTTSTFCPTS